MLKLGEVYDTMFPQMGGVSKDNILAVQYYLKAARLGYAPDPRVGNLAGNGGFPYRPQKFKNSAACPAR
jgi:TPR repeat protein